ncbi:long-chain fatty acid--CoA ligase [Paracoccus sp. MA]|uniref:AMP-binding protein n=1 Tax=Paracoccus sp. MA TaxID=2895796 RepID=UPI001E29388B|nr:AMP-binding protein [Paracoccus sp. MA]UFM66551.1 long-chain fatty acid--CoA ligase [Paracoccus sp. MA]
MPGSAGFPRQPRHADFIFGLADHAAFVFGTQTVTYGELVDEARPLASVLRDAGVAKGDCVAVLSPNRPEIFSTYLGLTMNGAAIVPVNAEFAPHEIRYILEHSGARMVEGWWSVRPNSPIS